MAFQLYHTVPAGVEVDYRVDAYRALEYWMNTFMPSRPSSTVNTSISGKYGFSTPSYDMLENNNLYGNYNWFNIPAEAAGSTDISFPLYEDARWTNQKGDLLEDTTNQKTWIWYESAAGYNGKAYRFWVSDQDPDVWFVMQGARHVCASWTPYFAYTKPWYETWDTVNVDNPMTTLWMPIHDTWTNTNYPNNSGASSSEYTLFTVTKSAFPGPPEACFEKFWPIMSNSAHPPGYCGAEDVRMYFPEQVQRSNVAPSTLAFGSGQLMTAGNLYKVYVNQTDWYLMFRNLDNQCVAYYIGPTEPDVS